MVRQSRAKRYHEQRCPAFSSNAATALESKKRLHVRRYGTLVRSSACMHALDCYIPSCKANPADTINRQVVDGGLRVVVDVMI